MWLSEDLHPQQTLILNFWNFEGRLCSDNSQIYVKVYVNTENVW